MYQSGVPRAQEKEMIMVFRQVDRLDRTLLEKLGRGLHKNSLVHQEAQLSKVLCSRQIS
jgi:hypothetical protein